MAFRTSRTSTVRGRPPRFAGRINGATSNHSASVRSLSYRRPRRSAAARWSGFHMRHLSPTQVPHKESQPIPETQLLSGWALMANPPFNVDEVDTDKIKGDKRLPFGLPGVNKAKKVSNANYLWISYFYSYLNETSRAGLIMSSQASSAGRDEAIVRQKLI